MLIVGLRKLIKKLLKLGSDPLSGTCIDRAEDLLSHSPAELVQYSEALEPEGCGFDVMSLLALAERRATTEAEQVLVRERLVKIAPTCIGNPFAENAKLSEASKPPPSAAPRIRAKPRLETSSQKRVRDFIVRLGRIHFHGDLSGLAIQPRLNPLIAGPTGVGKSHLVRAAAHSLGATYRQICYGDWVPSGARDRKDTRTVILELLLAHPRVLIHLDELDKWPLAGGTEASAWHTSLVNDLWGVLDHSFPLDDFVAAHPGVDRALLVTKIRRNLFYVGSGTWQSVCEQHARKGSLGFGAQRGLDQDLAEEIREARQISSELLARFHTDVQILSYPSPSETKILLHRAGIADLASRVGVTIRPEDIDYRRGGMRVLESVASNLLLRMEGP